MKASRKLAARLVLYFAMMVLMALLTTIMTGPVLRWIEKRQARSAIPASE